MRQKNKTNLIVIANIAGTSEYDLETHSETSTPQEENTQA